MTSLAEFADFAVSLCEIEARYEDLLARLSTMSLLTAASVLLASADKFRSTPMLPLGIDTLPASERYNRAVETCCLLRLDLKTVLPMGAMELLVFAHDTCDTPVPARLLCRSKIFLRHGTDALVRRFLRETRALAVALRQCLGRRGERANLPSLAALLAEREPH